MKAMTAILSLFLISSTLFAMNKPNSVRIILKTHSSLLPANNEDFYKGFPSNPLTEARQSTLSSIHNECGGSGGQVVRNSMVENMTFVGVEKGCQWGFQPCYQYSLSLAAICQLK